MARHVEFLSRLLLVWSAFTGIIGSAVLAFSMGAASLALTTGAERPGTEVAAGITAATLAVVGVTALAWAGVHYLCARGIRAYHPWARALGLALGVFDLPLVPLGSGVGAYMLWVLLQEETRQRFGAT